jgi:hypothetical protein
VQGRLSLLTDLPKVRRFTEVSSRASSFLMVRGTSRARLMQAMRQLGNCTKSTHGAMGEVVTRTFLRIVNGSRNPMNFSTRRCA